MGASLFLDDLHCKGRRLHHCCRLQTGLLFFFVWQNQDKPMLVVVVFVICPFWTENCARRCGLSLLRNPGVGIHQAGSAAM